MEYMDPTVMSVVFGLHGCSGFLVGLVFLVVGFVTVRSALPNAGYMVGAGGALQILSVCCTSWQQVGTVSGAMYDLVDSLGGVSNAIGLLFNYASIALTIAGAVFLSLELTKRRDAAPQGGA